MPRPDKLFPRSGRWGLSPEGEPLPAAFSRARQRLRDGDRQGAQALQGEAHFGQRQPDHADQNVILITYCCNSILLPILVLGGNLCGSPPTMVIVESHQEASGTETSLPLPGDLPEE